MHQLIHKGLVKRRTMKATVNNHPDTCIPSSLRNAFCVHSIHYRSATFAIIIIWKQLPSAHLGLFWQIMQNVKHTAGSSVIGVDFGGASQARGPPKLGNAYDFFSYCHMLPPIFWFSTIFMASLRQCFQFPSILFIYF